MAEGLLGTSWGVFIGVTLILFGLGAVMTGQALAQTWRPMAQVVPYALLLALGARFMIFALFEGSLLSLPGLLVAWAVLLLLAAATHRATKARLMVVQYPWLYERSGVFTWRERRAA